MTDAELALIEARYPLWNTKTADVRILLAAMREMTAERDAERATVERLRVYHAEDWRRYRERETELQAALLKEQAKITSVRLLNPRKILMPCEHLGGEACLQCRWHRAEEIVWDLLHIVEKWDEEGR